MNQKHPMLAFFFELNGSLDLWNSVGFLQREIELYNRLAKEYFKNIYFFTYGDSSDLAYQHLLEPNIIVVPLKKKPRSFPVAFLYEIALPFLHYSILRECDIIKTNQNSGSIAAAITKVLFPKKILVARSGYIGSELVKRAHLSYVVQLYYFIAERLTYKISNKNLIPTSENAEILSRTSPTLKNKISVHNNYINTELFRNTHSDYKKYDIIYVGRMDPDKNHQAILRATQNTNFQILFIGDGPERQSLLNQAKKLDVSLEHIPSIPNNELPRYYNASNICVFPSLHEGNPKALLEAMACELPVIAFSVPGVHTIIQHQKNGILVDDNTLKEGIISLFSSVQKQNYLGRNARQTVLHDFSFEKILDQEKNIYTALLNI